MTLKELAKEINDMPAAQQEQAALIQDDNSGEFIELTRFSTDDEVPMHLRQSFDAYTLFQRPS